MPRMPPEHFEIDERNNKLILFIILNMMDLLPEPILNKIYSHKHNLGYINSVNHIQMFKQHYDDIPRYTKQVYGDILPQIDMNIPIKRMLMPLQKNKIEIDTSNTTQFDGESNFLYSGEKYMKND